MQSLRIAAPRRRVFVQPTLMPGDRLDDASANAASRILVVDDEPQIAGSDGALLYLTGYSQALFNNRGVLWEGEAFLEKPCNPAAILEAVSLLLFGRVHRTETVASQLIGMRALLGSPTKNPRTDVV